MNSLNKIVVKTVFVCLIVLMTAAIYSCKDNVTSLLGNPQMSVSYKVDETALDNSASIILDSAKGLLEQVTVNGSSSKELKQGPFVLYFVLDGTINTFAIANIGGGTYDKVSFKFHKFNPGEPVLDPDFVGPSGGVGYSFVIAGKYNDTAFIYKSPKTALQEVSVNPTVLVNPAASDIYNVTILVNSKEWFLKDGVVLDPRDSVNFNDIDNNIKDSFKRAFKDNDKNGLPDS